MIELNKPYIVVYLEDKTIVYLFYDNVLTYPGIDSYYAEFDTAEELDAFLVSEGLLEISGSIVSKNNTSKNIS